MMFAEFFFFHRSYPLTTKQRLNKVTCFLLLFFKVAEMVAMYCILFTYTRNSKARPFQ